MRSPAAFYREIGPRSFMIAQILFGGMVVSAAVHPVFIGTLGWVGYNLAIGSPLSTFQSALLVVDTVNIVAGYVSFWLLGRQSTPPERRSGTWKIVLATPVYWMMMSYAAWRSLVQLYRKPHLCGLMYQEHQGSHCRSLAGSHKIRGCLSKPTTSLASVRAAMRSPSTAFSHGGQSACAAFA